MKFLGRTSAALWSAYTKPGYLGRGGAYVQARSMRVLLWASGATILAYLPFGRYGVAVIAPLVFLLAALRYGLYVRTFSYEPLAMARAIDLSLEQMKATLKKDLKDSSEAAELVRDAEQKRDSLIREVRILNEERLERLSEPERTMLRTRLESELQAFQEREEFLRSMVCQKSFEALEQGTPAVEETAPEVVETAQGISVDVLKTQRSARIRAFWREESGGEGYH